MKLEEIIEVVKDLNEIFYDDEYGDWIWISTTGYMSIVKLFDIHLWDSENDDRGYIDDGYTQVDLKTHLIDEINRNISRLSKKAVK